jgi:hypothetical protein
MKQNTDIPKGYFLSHLDYELESDDCQSISFQIELDDDLVKKQTN